MYTYCTAEEWSSDYFDLFECENENGLFATRDEAIHDAKKHGLKKIVVFNVD